MNPRLLLLAAPILALSLAAAAAPPRPVVQATVVHPIDGDTIKVDVPAWAGTPFEQLSVRIMGIDTPESHEPPGKCAKEVAKGRAAAAYAATLVKPGDAVTVTFYGFDKYGGRIDGAVTLADGRDWATLMLNGNYAAPYNGGAKRSWCGVSA